MKERPAAVGYRYGIAALLTGVLMLQAATIKYDRNGGWYFAFEPVPVEKGLPIIGLITALLVPQTTKVARKVGQIMGATDDDESTTQ